MSCTEAGYGSSLPERKSSAIETMPFLAMASWRRRSVVRSLRHQAPPWHSTSRKIAEEVRQRIRRERQYEEAQVSSAFRNGMWAWLDGQLMSNRVPLNEHLQTKRAARAWFEN